MESNNINGNNSVLDVSSYIINYCHKNDFTITNLKLQKLLYFCQATFLLESKGEVPCFSEPIIAWPYGPVVLKSYNLYSAYGSSEIPKVLNFDEKVIKGKAIIDSVLNAAANKNPFVLVDITHSQKPWINAFKKGQGAGTEITKKSIYNYFSNK